MRRLGPLGWKRLVVESFCGVGVEREIELVSPAEIETCAAQCVVVETCCGVPFCEVGGVRGELVSDDADLHVVPVGKAKMLLRRDVAQHRCSEPSDHRGADRARDVV